MHPRRCRVVQAAGFAPALLRREIQKNDGCPYWTACMCAGLFPGCQLSFPSCHTCMSPLQISCAFSGDERVRVGPFWIVCGVVETGKGGSPGRCGRSRTCDAGVKVPCLTVWPRIHVPVFPGCQSDINAVCLTCTDTATKARDRLDKDISQFPLQAPQASPCGRRSCVRVPMCHRQGLHLILHARGWSACAAVTWRPSFRAVSWFIGFPSSFPADIWQPF